MNCPVCSERMREITKFNVEVDICPSCKGVWLDRGELEKIIDMVSSGAGPVEGAVPPSSTVPRDLDRERGPLFHDAPPRMHDHDHDDHHDRRYAQHDDHDKHHDHDHDKHHGEYGHGRRKGWLSDLFD
jgi:uncharacterized protein